MQLNIFLFLFFLFFVFQLIGGGPSNNRDKHNVYIGSIVQPFKSKHTWHLSCVGVCGGWAEKYNLIYILTIDGYTILFNIIILIFWSVFISSHVFILHILYLFV